MQSVRDLRRQYFNEFKPMEDRYKHRTNLIFKQASESSPDILYKRDFSLVPVSDISLDDAIEKISLKDIGKTYTDRWSNKFSSEGLPIDNASTKNNIINEALYEMHLDDYSAGQKDAVKNILEEAYSRSVEAAKQYDIQAQQSQVSLERGRQELNEDKNPKSPRLSSYNWTNEANGISYKVYRDEQGNYYDKNKNKIEYDNEDDLIKKLVDSYSEYRTNPELAAKYKFVQPKSIKRRADGTFITSVGNIANATEVGEIKTYNDIKDLQEGETGIADYMDIVQKGLKELGLDLDGLITNSYSVKLLKTTNEYIIKVQKVSA
jgi:hypothetical protein